VFTLEQTILVGLVILVAVYFSYRKGQRDMVEFATAQTLQMLQDHDHIRVEGNTVMRIQDVINQEIITYHNEQNLPKK
jgi:hypothetical protein